MAHYFQLSELISIFIMHTARTSAAAAAAHAILFNYAFENYITMQSIHFMESCNVYVSCTLQISHPSSILWMCLCLDVCVAVSTLLQYVHYSNTVIRIFIRWKSNRSLNISWKIGAQLCKYAAFIIHSFHLILKGIRN